MSARTRVTNVEDGGDYVRYRGSHLEDMYIPPYNASLNVTSWTRDVVYLRPKVFVVYDRTSIASTLTNQWMAFHFGAVPTTGAGPVAGSSRITVGSGSTYTG